jgi:CMP-N,N'-diacetyllegionaminic acid synthase
MFAWSQPSLGSRRVGSNVALIPARAGSKRIPGKNSRDLVGHPLLAYSIAAAEESGVCDRIICSTDSPEIADLALSYGAEVPGLRPAELATDNAHDIGFVKHAIEQWLSPDDEFITLLRPPNPLRRGSSIARALEALKETPWADSIRALRPVSEHPGKMWRVDDKGEARTYLDQGGSYNGPTQDLERLFMQSSALEIVRSTAVIAHNSISGDRVLALELPGFESLDLNSDVDWMVMENLVSGDPSLLPTPKRK